MNPDAIDKANKGDLIEFDRENQVLQGIVEIVRENSVMVDLTYNDNYKKLEEKHKKTIVAHHNYTIIAEGEN